MQASVLTKCTNGSIIKRQLLHFFVFLQNTPFYFIGSFERIGISDKKDPRDIMARVFKYIKNY